MKGKRCGTQAGQEGFGGQSRAEAAVSHTQDFIKSRLNQSSLCVFHFSID